MKKIIWQVISLKDNNDHLFITCVCARVHKLIYLFYFLNPCDMAVHKTRKSIKNVAALGRVLDLPSFGDQI